MPFLTKTTEGGASYLHFDEWTAAGVEHGFTGTSLNFWATYLSLSCEKLKRAFNLDLLLIPMQVHGPDIVDLRGASTKKDFETQIRSTTTPNLEEADSVIITPDVLKNVRVAIGIRTADCVPLIVRSTNHLAVVHAGWRGLANGVIERTLKKISENGDNEASVLIGPCAGGDRYEVGPEVIEAIGKHAVHRDGNPGKFLLATGKTAAELAIHSGVMNVSVNDCDICTISNENYYSYRRSGKIIGENLAFVIAGTGN